MERSGKESKVQGLGAGLTKNGGKAYSRENLWGRKGWRWSGPDYGIVQAKARVHLYVGVGSAEVRTTRHSKLIARPIKSWNIGQCFSRRPVTRWSPTSTTSRTILYVMRRLWISCPLRIGLWGCASFSMMYSILFIVTTMILTR